MGRSIDKRQHPGKHKGKLGKYQNVKSRRISGEVKVTKMDDEPPEPLTIGHTVGLDAVEAENQRKNDMVQRKVALYAKKNAEHKNSHRNVMTGRTYTAAELDLLGGSTRKRNHHK